MQANGQDLPKEYQRVVNKLLLPLSFKFHDNQETIVYISQSVFASYFAVNYVI